MNLGRLSTNWWQRIFRICQHRVSINEAIMRAFIFTHKHSPSIQVSLLNFALWSDRQSTPSYLSLILLVLRTQGRQKVQRNNLIDSRIKFLFFLKMHWFVLNAKVALATGVVFGSPGLQHRLMVLGFGKWRGLVSFDEGVDSEIKSAVVEIVNRLVGVHAWL